LGELFESFRFVSPVFRLDCTGQNFNATAPQAQLHPGQKKRQPSVLPRLAQFVLRGWLYRDRNVFGAPGADDLIGSTEDSLSALFGYRFRIRTAATGEPILNVSSAKLRSLKP
jgi:hypothetical protein